MSIKINKTNNEYIVYDQSLIEQCPSNYFSSDYWENEGEIEKTPSGRGSSWFINIGNRNAVLRHYRRGGLIRHLLHDQYIWMGNDNVRSLNEFHLFNKLTELKLPVPQVIAARFTRSGLIYRCDIICERIPTCKPLSQLDACQIDNLDIWRNLGRCLAAFHKLGVCHADLNAHNILIDTSNGCYLIDFDRGFIRPEKPSWQRANIERLERSLSKLAKQNNFSNDWKRPWSVMIEEYNDALKNGLSET